LFNGLVLTNVVILHRQTERSDNSNSLITNIKTHTTMSTLRNSVTLIGRPGAEPEMRSFNNNMKVARFRMAVNERHRNANNEWVTDTQWFPVVAWGAAADRVMKNVQKGKQVAIAGSLRNNEWIDEKGQRHLTTEVRVDDLLLMDKIKD
jgi:single-strand DNA-binding protein